MQVLELWVEGGTDAKETQKNFWGWYSYLYLNYKTVNMSQLNNYATKKAFTIHLEAVWPYAGHLTSLSLFPLL